MWRVTNPNSCSLSMVMRLEATARSEQSLAAASRLRSNRRCSSITNRYSLSPYCVHCRELNAGGLVVSDSTTEVDSAVLWPSPATHINSPSEQTCHNFNLYVEGFNAVTLDRGFLISAHTQSLSRVVVFTSGVGISFFMFQHVDLCYLNFYARKQLLLSARLSHRNSVCPSVCPSVTRVDQSKTVQVRITKSLPSGARKILVSETVKLLYTFDRGSPRTRALNERAGWAKFAIFSQ